MLDLEGTGIPKQMSEELSVTKKRNRKHHNLFYKTKITSCSLLNICDIPPTLKKKFTSWNLILNVMVLGLEPLKGP